MQVRSWKCGQRGHTCRFTVDVAPSMSRTPSGSRSDNGHSNRPTFTATFQACITTGKSTLQTCTRVTPASVIPFHLWRRRLAAVMLSKSMTWRSGDSAAQASVVCIMVNMSRLSALIA